MYTSECNTLPPFLSKRKKTKCDALSVYLLVTDYWVLNDAFELHSCDKLEMMWKEAIMTHFGYYLSTC
jgi:hypothetical protein